MKLIGRFITSVLSFKKGIIGFLSSSRAELHLASVLDGVPYFSCAEVPLSFPELCEVFLSMSHSGSSGQIFQASPEMCSQGKVDRRKD